MFIYIQQHSTFRRIYVSSGRLVARPLHPDKWRARSRAPYGTRVAAERNSRGVKGDEGRQRDEDVVQLAREGNPWA